MTVADELAALRAKGAVKTHATNLEKDGFAALSTPEAEEAALASARREGLKKKAEASEILKKGGSGYSREMEYTLSQIGRKKEGLEKKAEASEILKKGGSGYSREVEYTLSQTGRKKAEWEKKKKAKKLLNSGGVLPSDIKNGEGEKTDVVSNAAAIVAPKSYSSPVETEDNDKEGEVDDHNVIQEMESPRLTKAMTVDASDTTGGDVEVETEADGGRQVMNRQEKKTRKMMMRLGMRPVQGIARMTLKMRGGRDHFFIDGPDVFFGGGGCGGGKIDTYVIFGEARQGGGGGRNGSAQSANAAASFSSGGPGATIPCMMDEVDDNIPTLTTDDDADDDGVNDKDVDLVMTQVSCSRAKAVAALKDNDGDLVNAIMSLTT
jgi:nascent polypeptide-associated complex subunit alpha